LYIRGHAPCENKYGKLRLLSHLPTNARKQLFFGSCLISPSTPLYLPRHPPSIFFPQPPTPYRERGRTKTKHPSNGDTRRILKGLLLSPSSGLIFDDILRILPFLLGFPSPLVTPPLTKQANQPTFRKISQLSPHQQIISSP